jgi:hypothetical protein
MSFGLFTPERCFTQRALRACKFTGDLDVPNTVGVAPNVHRLGGESRSNRYTAVTGTWLPALASLRTNIIQEAHESMADGS